ncbi:helix-turn-helix transcriptional regulator [Chryseobacterium oryctis]|uniref:Helix-turn-helix domain-containing protein n=1 Tax=Chryseobacterium oryctis TaxID=2952618 RepID=A0ABT3HR12_9FLAO|nr:helix-turn-helix transcriptional regulator [Chryseobacterium oryctis]MCW3162184.1 helix-turn-helix domain-containing protein [Chryseobacterium oryctis]
MMATKTKLQETRIKKGLSQEQIANMLGMTQSNYSRKENGSSKISQREWEKLSKTLEVPMEDIFENDDSHIFIFQDHSTGNYKGINNIYSIPEHIEQLLETQRKYIDKLEEENQTLREEINTLKRS